MFYVSCTLYGIVLVCRNGLSQFMRRQKYHIVVDQNDEVRCTQYGIIASVLYRFYNVWYNPGCLHSIVHVASYWTFIVL